jgi:hypothetical protein
MSRLNPSWRNDPGARHMAAGVVAIALLVLLALLGVAGQVTSSLSHSVRAAGTAVALDQAGDSRTSGSGSSRGSGSRIASLHAVPSPGYFCTAKGGVGEIKLILTQERYDRLVNRGWALGPGGGQIERVTRLACPRFERDAGDD